MQRMHHPYKKTSQVDIFLSVVLIGADLQNLLNFLTRLSTELLAR